MKLDGLGWRASELHQWKQRLQETVTQVTTCRTSWSYPRKPNLIQKGEENSSRRCLGTAQTQKTGGRSPAVNDKGLGTYCFVGAMVGRSPPPPDSREVLVLNTVPKVTHSVKKLGLGQGVMAYICNPSTREAEPRRLSSKPVWMGLNGESCLNLKKTGLYKELAHGGFHFMNK